MVVLRELLLSLFNALAMEDEPRARALAAAIELRYQVDRDAAWSHGYRQGRQDALGQSEKGKP